MFQLILSTFFVNSYKNPTMYKRNTPKMGWTQRQDSAAYSTAQYIVPGVMTQRTESGDAAWLNDLILSALIIVLVAATPPRPRKPEGMLEACSPAACTRSLQGTAVVGRGPEWMDQCWTLGGWKLYMALWGTSFIWHYNASFLWHTEAQALYNTVRHQPYMAL